MTTPLLTAQGQTLTLASCNLLNLALPGHAFYANQRPYPPNEYARKTAWLGERLRALNADVVAVQEVWHLEALREAVQKSGLQYGSITAPLADPVATHTPAVGVITRLSVVHQQSFVDFDTSMHVDVPELGTMTRFERPPLLLKLQGKHGPVFGVLVVHLKSKRPKFLQDTQGQPTEDRQDPVVTTRAALRSLIIRGAEAAALRHILINLLRDNPMPLVMLGDFNDSTRSVTTQMVAATSEVSYNRRASDVALFDAYDVQGENALKKDVAYSHIYQGSPEVLDQILVSEAFVPHSRYAIGDVRRVDYFNDHLHEGRDRTRSDHGFVRATLRIYAQEPRFRANRYGAVERVMQNVR